MKKSLFLILISASFYSSYGQQFALYNSRTLYDVFENPSQSAYQIDTSRQIAFNFFIPTFSLNSAFSGPAEPAFKQLLYDGVFNGNGISIGQDKLNTLSMSSNTYIAMLRILKTVKKSREIGASWQIRSDGRIKVTNETLVIFDNYELFPGSTFTGIFNNRGNHQSYHQFSLTYRQDIDRRLSVGVKGSLLSGISYNSFRTYQSQLDINSEYDEIDVSLAGRFRSSFHPDSGLRKKDIYPLFRHPGLSFTAGGSYKLRDGWFILGNLKDIGFIKWNRVSYENNFNTGRILIEEASSSTADNRLADSLEMKIKANGSSRSYLSTLNGKAEVLINKNFGNYHPNLILSKSLFYEGGDIVLTNNYHFRDWVFTLSADYNMMNYLGIGGQIMIKSPNTEFFIGSDNLFKTIEVINNAGGGNYPYSRGATGFSFYLGFGVKFGRLLEHPANSGTIPGFEKDPEGGLFRKLLKKKEKGN